MVQTFAAMHTTQRPPLSWPPQISARSYGLTAAQLLAAEPLPSSIRRPAVLLLGNERRGNLRRHMCGNKESAFTSLFVERARLGMLFSQMRHDFMNGFACGFLSGLRILIQFPDGRWRSQQRQCDGALYARIAVQLDWARGLAKETNSKPS